MRSIRLQVMLSAADRALCLMGKIISVEWLSGGEGLASFIKCSFIRKDLLGWEVQFISITIMMALVPAG